MSNVGGEAKRHSDVSEEGPVPTDKSKGKLALGRPISMLPPDEAETAGEDR